MARSQSPRDWPALAAWVSIFALLARGTALAVFVPHAKSDMAARITSTMTLTNQILVITAALLEAR